MCPLDVTILFLLCKQTFSFSQLLKHFSKNCSPFSQHSKHNTFLKLHKQNPTFSLQNSNFHTETAAQSRQHFKHYTHHHTLQRNNGKHNCQCARMFFFSQLPKHISQCESVRNNSQYTSTILYSSTVGH